MAGNLERVLLVDGYNIINSWPELRRLKRDMGAARDKLCDLLGEYVPQPYAFIIVVFDAYLVAGNKVSWSRAHGIQVVFTGEAETADAFIAGLVSALRSKDENLQIEVATSDAQEQLNVFSRGALRLSSRELALSLREDKERLRTALTGRNKQRPRLRLNDYLTPELKEGLEKMRREK